MQRSRIPFFAVSALAGAVFLSGCGQSEQAQGQTQAAQAVPVGVIEMQSKPLTLTKELPGRVSASRIAEIRPQVNGIIQSRLFVEGSDVK